MRLLCDTSGRWEAAREGLLPGRLHGKPSASLHPSHAVRRGPLPLTRPRAATGLPVQLARGRQGYDGSGYKQKVRAFDVKVRNSKNGTGPPLGQINLQRE